MSKKLLLCSMAVLLVSGLVFWNFYDDEQATFLADPIAKKVDKKNGKLPKNQRGQVGYFEYLKTVRTPLDAPADYQGYPKNYVRKEYEKALQQKQQIIKGLSPAQQQRFLQMEGKAPMTVKGAGLSAKFDSETVVWEDRGPVNVPGRTREIIFFEDEPDTWWIGTVSGGIWKTTDAGITWTCLSDDLSSLATSFIAIPESDRDVIYAGLGEPHAITDIFQNTGLYKSMDGGESWTYLNGTEAFSEVSRIQVDPDNPDVVMVATAAGMYRSMDGGATFTDVSPAGTSNSFVQDLKFFEGDFNIQYAFIQELNPNAPDIDANNNGVFWSSDAGLTWTKTGNLPFVDGFVNRGEMAVSPRNSNVVYVSTTTSDSPDDLDIVFVSVDSGSTWEVALNLDEVGAYSLGRQGTYNNTIVVHPFDDSIVYLGGVETFKLEIIPTGVAGGFATTVTTPMTINQSLTIPQVNANVHVDHHNLKVIRRSDTTFQILGANDGGISLSDVGADPGIGEGTWNNSPAFTLQAGNLTNGPTEAVIGVNSTQFYSAHKTKGLAAYVGGTQDNGSWLSEEGGDITGKSTYARVSGGDGFYALAHPINTDWFLTTAQFNRVFRTTDRGQTANLTSLDFALDGPFLTIINNSSARPDVVYAANNSGVWRSADFGESWNLVPITEPIFNGNASRSNRIAVNECDASRVLVACAFGTFSNGSQIPVFTSTDGGLSFQPKALDFNANSAFFAQALDISEVNPDRIYVGNSVAGAGKVFRSNDFGDTWEDISGFTQGEDRGFPDAGVFAILEMPFDENVVWVSTDIGMMQTVDGGASWSLLETDLPNVVVDDMKIVDNEVVLATYGRGIWTATIPELEAISNNQVIGSAPVEVELPLRSNILSVKYGSYGEDYDRIELIVDGEFITELDNARPADGEFNTYEYALEEDRPSGEIKVVVRYFGQGQSACLGGGTVTFDMERSANYIDYKDAVKYYANDFERAYDTSDFFSFGGSQFTVGTPNNLQDNVLHVADNPYNDGGNYISYLTVPIIVTDEPLNFNNIALVEAGSDFGANFFDFVVVEATTDGEEWIPVVDRYDQRANTLWAGDITRDPTEDMFATQSVQLSNFFELDEEVVLRFRLEADGSVNGWGWAIDDIDLSPSGEETVFSFEEGLDGWQLSGSYLRQQAIWATDGEWSLRMKGGDVSKSPVATYADDVDGLRFTASYNAVRAPETADAPLALELYYNNLETGERSLVKALRLGSNVNSISGVVNNPGSRGQFELTIAGDDPDRVVLFLDDIRITSGLDDVFELVEGVSFEEGNEGWTLTRAARVQDQELATDGEWSVSTRQFSLFSTPRFDLEGYDKVKLSIRYKQRNITANTNNAVIQIGYTDENTTSLSRFASHTLAPGDVDDGLIEVEWDNPGNGFRFTLNSRRIGGSQNNGFIYYDVATISVVGRPDNGDGTAAASVAGAIDGEPSTVIVYPNPTQGPLQTANVAAGIKYDVVNTMGTIVQSGQTSAGNVLDISTQRKGLYFVRFHTPKGIVTQRIIKE